MRLGVGLKEQMKKQILEDLYDKNISRVLEDRRQIVRDNYMEWLAQHQPNLDKIPAGFINTAYEVRMDACKALGVEPDSYDGIYDARFETPVPQCVDSNQTSYYSRSYAVPASDTYVKPIQDNHEELVKLIKEKEEATSYLDKSYEQCTSTTQLRKFWPQALHKYIPPEPARAKRQPKELDTSATDDIQDTLTMRMANNLLEG